MWAAIINFERLGKADAAGDAQPDQAANGKRAAQYIVDVLASCAADTVPGHGPKRYNSDRNLHAALQPALRASEAPPCLPGGCASSTRRACRYCFATWPTQGWSVQAAATD